MGNHRIDRRILTKKDQVLEVMRAGGRIEAPRSVSQFYKLYDAAGNQVEAWQNAIRSAEIFTRGRPEFLGQVSMGKPK